MGLIDRAILQDEISQALNALFRNGQLPRIETTKTAVEILREPKLEFEDGQTAFRYQFTAGATYEVILDGVTYVRKAFDVEFNGESGVVLGNASLYGYADTGEPFVIIPNVFAIISEVGSGGTSEHSIVFSKIEETETIHPIDPKYLPEGGVGYTETSNGLTFDGDATGKEVYDETFVKISDTPVNAEDVTAVFVFDGDDGKKYAVEEMAVQNNNGTAIVSGKIEYDSGGTLDGMFVVSVTADSAPLTKGVYVWKQGGIYVCEIQGVKTENVHQFDQKYIPPLDSLTINGTDGNQYKLTVNNGSISVAEVV